MKLSIILMLGIALKVDQLYSVSALFSFYFIVQFYWNVNRPNLDMSQKRLDQKYKINFNICDVATWLTSQEVKAIRQ